MLSRIPGCTQVGLVLPLQLVGRMKGGTDVTTQIIMISGTAKAKGFTFLKCLGARWLYHVKGIARNSS